MSEPKLKNESTDLVIPSSQDLTKSVLFSTKLDIRKYWDREYINSKIDNITDRSDRMLIQFLWMSGVRISEAVSLMKGQIDFKNYTMTLKWLKSRKYKYRIAPLHPRLRELLQLYTSAMLSDQLIFPITRQRAWQICKKHLQGYPHQLRHSFAVNWLRCDGDLVMLHRILGHSKIQTTMEYLKIVPVDQGKELLKITF